MAPSPNMSRINGLIAEYPRQFWLLLGGAPHYLYGRQHVLAIPDDLCPATPGVPMTTVGLLLGLYSAAGLVATLLAGSLADRTGRMAVMLIGLFGGATTYVAMSQATSLPQWAILTAAASSLSE